MTNLEQLSNLVQEWKDVEGVKPENQPQFIEVFLACLKEACYDDFTFDGDGAYFGKQITWEVGSYYCGNRDINLHFEIAYDSGHIRVYNGRCDGYWTSEYISLNNGDVMFDDIKVTLGIKLLEVFGLEGYYG